MASYSFSSLVSVGTAHTPFRHGARCSGFVRAGLTPEASAYNCRHAECDPTYKRVNQFGIVCLGRRLYVLSQGAGPDSKGAAPAVSEEDGVRFPFESRKKRVATAGFGVCLNT